MYKYVSETAEIKLERMKIRKLPGRQILTQNDYHSVIFSFSENNYLCPMSALFSIFYSNARLWFHTKAQHCSSGIKTKKKRVVSQSCEERTL